MKKIGVVIGTTLFSLKLFALGGVNIMTSPTVSSLGNPVQQAEISSNSVFFNPSSIAFLENGNYLGLGISFSNPEYKQRITGPFGNRVDFEVDNMQYIPSGEYIYKNGDRAYYIGVGSMGQGGSLDVSQNLLPIRDIKLDYLAPGIVFGIAQRLNEKVAVSIGGRYTYVYQKLEFKANRDYELKITGDGIAPEFGIFYKPTAQWDLSAKYLFKTKINQNKSGNLEQPLAGALSSRHDYPALLSTGASYLFKNSDRFYVGYNAIFEKANNVYGGGYNGAPNYSNTNEYMLGYKKRINEKFDINLGYTHVDRGNNGEPLTIKEIDANVYGISLVYHQNKDTSYTLGLSTNRYNSSNSDFFGAKRRENTIGIAASTKI